MAYSGWLSDIYRGQTTLSDQTEWHKGNSVYLPGFVKWSCSYVDGCFSFCFYDVIIDFLTNRTKILIWRQAFISLQHGFLRSEENVVLYNFETPEGVWENVMSYNILTLIFIKPLFETDVMPQCYVGKCFCLADVICHMRCGRCYNHWGRCYILILFISSRCYCHLMLWKMLYHIPASCNMLCWQMLLPVADGIATTGQWLNIKW